MSKILAIDVGYGNVKSVWGNARNDSCENIFRSLAPRTRKKKDALAGFTDPLDRVSVEVDGGHFLVGKEAYLVGGEPILDTNYIAHPEYLAYVLGSIYYMQKKSGTIINSIDGLVVGLPVSNFSKHRAALANLVQGPHTIPAPGNLQNIYGPTIEVKIGKVLVLPQPLGALRSHAAAGSAADPKSTNLVIDVGYNTFDWLTSMGMRADMERSGNFEGGVAQLIREVSSQVGSELGIGVLDFVDCENALSTGTLMHKGVQHSFTQYADIVDNMAGEMVNKFMNSQKSNRGFTNIIVTGGGAKYFKNALQKRFPDYPILVEPDSVMANARGFYSFGVDLI